MTEEELKRIITSKEFLLKTIEGATEALMYTEEEIYDTFEKEDAEEFIALRKECMKNMGLSYDTNEMKNSVSYMLAADEDSNYEQGNNENVAN